MIWILVTGTDFKVNEKLQPVYQRVHKAYTVSHVEHMP